MIEQKERMPFIPKENPANGIHIIEFTGNKYVGRYGFFMMCLISNKITLL